VLGGARWKLRGDSLRLRKFQAPKNKSQINPNDPNSKFETTEFIAGKAIELVAVGFGGVIDTGPE